MDADNVIEAIQSKSADKRNTPFLSLFKNCTTDEILEACKLLDDFRRCSESLYEKVRATLFLYAAHRFLLQDTPHIQKAGVIPSEGYSNLLSRRFVRAINQFLSAEKENGPDGTLLSALAEAYHQLTFDTLILQVRQSVRNCKGNQWMFRVGHHLDHPLRIRSELFKRESKHALFPVLEEATPVRLDLTHSAWSDIFFLGMDFPEGARVINISVDLGVCGKDTSPRPPISVFIRVIEEPLIRITSIDLKTTKDISTLDDLFNFGNDYLSLLKAGIIASGLVPPSFEGTGHGLPEILNHVVGPGMGMEVVTQVNGIPKGSRLAVSTNLLAGIITALMRASSQTEQLEGGLTESERRVIASRAILGEWLGGSGGGWQDSGGIWPGIKAIEGALTQEFDPEFGVSKGALLPRHFLLEGESIHPETLDNLSRSMVLIHGGMAQNVGPILEMVTEKYLLRSGPEWEARQEAIKIYDEIKSALKEGDIRKLSKLTTANWNGPLKTIIPRVTNQFTERIIWKAGKMFGEDFWGFLMLGGMSGGGMAMFCSPEIQQVFQREILEIMKVTREDLKFALPFAIEPQVYDFQVNRKGTWAKLRQGSQALMPDTYYHLQTPGLVAKESGEKSLLRKAEFDYFTASKTSAPEAHRLLRSLVSNLFRVTQPPVRASQENWNREADKIKKTFGFDANMHEQIRNDLKQGRIGLARNRLSQDIQIKDVLENDVISASALSDFRETGEAAIRGEEAAVFTLAAGVGSRWTRGAGVIKALNPFIMLKGRHHNFLDIHIAKTRKTNENFQCNLPHIIATSFMTHGPVSSYLEKENPGVDITLSPGRSIGQRLVPMVRDLQFFWEETHHEKLDEQKQKVVEMQQKGLMAWAREKGEGSDYVDNLPLQRFNPPGHWHEVPNLLKNGVLNTLLQKYPNLKTIFLHNLDTLGVSVSPEILGYHLKRGNALTFEVIPRRINDKGGGLARVNGHLRLLEGMAQPRESDELNLRYYNTMTTWIQIDPLLSVFGLTRQDISGPIEKISEAIRHTAQRLPSYATIKDVKYRWGHGHEDIYPVMQFEKLWSDMSALPDLQCDYVAVPRNRGQQLKDIAELDAWENDGSRELVENLCRF